MAIAILLPLIVLSLGEIAVFILVGDAIGVWRTVALVFLSILAGLLVLRVQGVMTLVRVRDALRRGEAPEVELFDGACLLVAGILLMIPGFLTDIVALLLLLPLVRNLLRRFIWSRISGQSHTHVWVAGRARSPGGGPGDRPPNRPGPVIEGDFEEVPPQDDHRSDQRSDDRPRPDGDADR
jgi:UPF0716 protein FxsA